jgi:hypothetical protein
MAKSIPKVTGMDWIVEKFSYEKMAPDEFTAEMVAAKSGANIRTVRSSLNEMRRKGELDYRKLPINGKQQTVYRQAKSD